MKKKKKGKFNYVIVAAIVLCLCGVVSYQKLELSESLEKSQKQLTELKAEKEALEAEKDEISDYETYVKTKKYIEEVAREKLGLVYEDEIIFKSENN